MPKYPLAIQRPTNKHGYKKDDKLLGQGIVGHSMEGSLTAAFGRLDGPDAASWHFSVAKNGDIYQHIDTDNISYASGSYDANRRFWSIEHEGVAGEPLTDAQQWATTELMGWLLHLAGLPAVRRDSLWEHNEMVAYGASPTACPSGRIPWAEIITDIEGGGEDMPSQAEWDSLKNDVAVMAQQVNSMIPQVAQLITDVNTLSQQLTTHYTQGHGPASDHEHAVTGTAQ